jgi:hypothetical protein
VSLALMEDPCCFGLVSVSANYCTFFGVPPPFPGWVEEGVAEFENFLRAALRRNVVEN